MTKAEMIETIQKTEAAMYLEYCKYKSLFGKDHAITVTLRKRWAAVMDLMSNLKLKADCTLPDNQLATEYETR